MRERTAYLIFIGVSSLLMLFFDRIGARGAAKRSSSSFRPGVAQAMSTSRPKINIFCYGDSLTAGTAPPEMQEFPYAPHLERTLQASNKNIMVRHLGLPGWTSRQLLLEATGAYGLRTAITGGPHFDLAILLAGTNDLGMTPEPKPIIDSIIGLHQLCHEAGVPHTLAVGIPPSGYQSQVQEAADKARAVNSALAQYCSNEPKATYVEFPFPYERGGDKWSLDGLHFSPRGYQLLGESLAPIVEQILQT